MSRAKIAEALAVSAIMWMLVMVWEREAQGPLAQLIRVYAEAWRMFLAALGG